MTYNKCLPNLYHFVVAILEVIKHDSWFVSFIYLPYCDYDFSRFFLDKNMRTSRDIVR